MEKSSNLFETTCSVFIRRSEAKHNRQDIVLIRSYTPRNQSFTCFHSVTVALLSAFTCSGRLFIWRKKCVFEQRLMWAPEQVKNMRVNIWGEDRIWKQTRRQSEFESMRIHVHNSTAGFIHSEFTLTYEELRFLTPSLLPVWSKVSLKGNSNILPPWKHPWRRIRRGSFSCQTERSQSSYVSAGYVTVCSFHQWVSDRLSLKTRKFLTWTNELKLLWCRSEKKSMQLMIHKLQWRTV